MKVEIDYHKSRFENANYMKMRLAAILIILFIILYYDNYSTFQRHLQIDFSNIQRATIHSNKNNTDRVLEPIEICGLAIILDNPLIFEKHQDSTPSHLINIMYNDGRSLIISGTTQGFHYIQDGENEYKISSFTFSSILRMYNDISISALPLHTAGSES